MEGMPHRSITLTAAPLQGPYFIQGNRAAWNVGSAGLWTNTAAGDRADQHGGTTDSTREFSRHKPGDAYRNDRVGRQRHDSSRSQRVDTERHHRPRHQVVHWRVVENNEWQVVDRAVHSGSRDQQRLLPDDALAVVAEWVGEKGAGAAQVDPSKI
jgi:hypothetical protein